MPYSGIAKGYHFRLYNRLQKKRHTCFEVGGISRNCQKADGVVFKRMQKTKNMANVPIGDDLMEVIGPRGEGLVFNGLTTYMLTYPMKRWFKSIGIKKDLHFHCTRHTYATLSLALGTDIITIKNVLGHKQESTTMRYTKVVNPLKEQAAKRLSINTISQNTEQYEKGNF